MRKRRIRLCVEGEAEFFEDKFHILDLSYEDANLVLEGLTFLKNKKRGDNRKHIIGLIDRVQYFIDKFG